MGKGLNDPSMFMSSPDDNVKVPTKLEFAVVGNLTADIEATQLECGKLHIGHYHSDWWFGSPDCAKVEVDPAGSPHSLASGGSGNPPIPPPKQHQFVCPCDGGAYIQFAQPRTAKHDVQVDINDCTLIKKKVGQWVQVGSSPGSQTYEFDYGVERDYTVSKTNTWGHTTTIQTHAGFSFSAFSFSIDVTHETSYQFAEEHSETFSMSSTEHYSTTVGAGMIWQFKMDITDNCGTSGVHMKDIQVTPNGQSPPCCLPGFFKNISDPWGDCLEVGGKVYNVCKKGAVVV